MSQTLLIVDDEADIVALLKDYFELGGYSVLTAGNGYEALQQMEKSPDLVLLDINMPEMDGLAVCAKIRRFAAYPILFLTAKAEDADKIIGFRTGGDDYIVKPFSIEELGARVAAHLRREERSHSRSKAKFAGDLVIDYGERAVFYRNEPVPLAKKEFEIIAFLSQNAGQVFDKERIYERLWGFDSEGDNAVVAEHIRRIRAKLASAECPNCIETVWGVGYKWIG
ncbi:MAG: response regulator transcription factor [Paenibacillus macerans]|uniref:response regulator transcription factor n=1 Tax=Paenibacillus TaxID=44249 RepID=UPI000EC3D71F|nr:response regulator transcription factor [Paenibacillus macerans]MDU5948918.1 response regulator transcription factor [Paenibacillus macerans]MDU7476625.1 response regulator transcription factor [Paenibacillus macerans]GBK64712.1 DNA-binding response regulator [Paenibacillus macerans]GBK70854.1 DNA-binding response regulator [Paenibacillus macerans]GIP11960.1 DNA-binding response regulator [Paenibacillus macerans]